MFEAIAQVNLEVLQRCGRSLAYATPQHAAAGCLCLERYLEALPGPSVDSKLDTILNRLDALVLYAKCTRKLLRNVEVCHDVDVARLFGFHPISAHTFRLFPGSRAAELLSASNGIGRVLDGYRIITESELSASLVCHLAENVTMQFQGMDGTIDLVMSPSRARKLSPQEKLVRLNILFQYILLENAYYSLESTTAHGSRYRFDHSFTYSFLTDLFSQAPTAKRVSVHLEQPSSVIIHHAVNSLRHDGRKGCSEHPTSLDSSFVLRAY